MDDNKVQIKESDVQDGADTSVLQTISSPVPEEFMNEDNDKLVLKRVANVIANNSELHHSLLQKLVDTQKDMMQRLSTAIQNNDATSIEMLSYLLKRISGNIGATEIQMNAEQLELMVQHNCIKSEMESLFKKLEKDVNQEIDSLETRDFILEEEVDDLTGNR